MDDEVTKRFSAEELESWNLLTRSNNNFHYISLRLTVLWGLGLLIRYGFLLPLRYELYLQHRGCFDIRRVTISTQDLRKN